VSSHDGAACLFSLFWVQQRGQDLCLSGTKGGPVSCTRDTFRQVVLTQRQVCNSARGFNGPDVGVGTDASKLAGVRSTAPSADVRDVKRKCCIFVATLRCASATSHRRDLELHSACCRPLLVVASLSRNEGAQLDAASRSTLLTSFRVRLQGVEEDLRAQVERIENENKHLKLQLESQYQTMIHMTDTIAKTHVPRIQSAAASLSEANGTADLQVRHTGAPATTL
jgi:hypothetical protein